MSASDIAVNMDGDKGHGKDMEMSRFTQEEEQILEVVSPDRLELLYMVLSRWQHYIIFQIINVTQEALLFCTLPYMSTK